MRRLVVAAAVTLTALAPVPGRAAALQVETRNFEYLPGGLPASAGDTITWNVTSGSHTVTAWDGDDFTSPVLVSGQSFTTTFGGGTVRYRCTIHSEVTAGACDGMCGVLSSAPPAIVAPAITSPADGAVINDGAADVAGTAPANAAEVRITENGATVVVVPVSAQSWSRRLPFAAGAHTLRATALDADGFESGPSAPVTFTIQLPDTQAPTVHITGPRDPIEVNPLKIAGRADDPDGIVTTVRAEVRDVLGRVVEPAVTCTGCGTASALFNADLPVLPGPYTVTVIATDAAGHTGQASENVIIL